MKSFGVSHRMYKCYFCKDYFLKYRLEKVAMKSLAVPKETTLSAAQDQTTNKDDVSVRSSDPDPAGERKHQYELTT